mmetsp:Transcript_57506/g.125006  ORF Transcript_57506/g.125006 Transcript_57506/m.125006 type:complete len:154 (+) Transcript_57506:383-844(+)
MVETSTEGRMNWNKLHTVIGLAKGPAAGQSSDPDPKYKNVTGQPTSNLLANLDFGGLTYMYDYVVPNRTGYPHNVMQHLFPTTAITIGPGFVVGEERIVTKVNGNYSLWGSEGCLLLFNPAGMLTSHETVTSPAAIKLPANSVAVVTPGECAI